MDQGDSLDEAQTPTKCQFCGEPGIQWKCFDCNMYLCQPCYNIHSKMKSSKGHTMINCNDIGTDEAADRYRKNNLDDLICSVHEGKKCIIFCKDCNKLICILCSKGSHKSHDMDDLWDSYENLFRKIKQFKVTVDEQYSILKSHADNIQKIFQDSKKHYDTAKAKILQNEKEIIKAIERYTLDMLQKMDSMFQPIQDEFTMTQANIKDLSQKNDKLEKVLSSYSAEDIFTSGSSLDTKLPEITTNEIYPSHFKFTPCDLPALSSSKVFGVVDKVPALKLKKSYNTKLEWVTKIIHCGKGAKFIGDNVNCQLQKVVIDNDDVIVKNTKDIAHYDMTMMENGDIVISTLSKNLMLYTKDGTLKTYKSFSLKTLGVHINKQNELIVGLTESSLINIKPDSTRKVVVLNQSLDIIHTYQYDNNNQRIFTWPWRIVTCNDTICVADLQGLYHQSGRVVALDYRGQIKWNYNGEGLGEREEFWPQDMTVTSTDMVLVTDNINHAIHVLNHAGKSVVCLQIKDIGIKNPSGIDMDHEGKLWVGCRTCTHKIHCFELL